MQYVELPNIGKVIVKLEDIKERSRKYTMKFPDIGELSDADFGLPPGGYLRGALNTNDIVYSFYERDNNRLGHVESVPRSGANNIGVRPGSGILYVELPRSGFSVGNCRQFIVDLLKWLSDIVEDIYREWQEDNEELQDFLEESL